MGNYLVPTGMLSMRDSLASTGDFPQTKVSSETFKLEVEFVSKGPFKKKKNLHSFFCVHIVLLLLFIVAGEMLNRLNISKFETMRRRFAYNYDNR